MKASSLFWVSTLALFACLTFFPIRLGSQQQKQTPYSVADLGTLGGTLGRALALSNKAWVVGDATLPGDTVFHGFLWRKGSITDLNTLGGPDSSAMGVNGEGDVVGVSESEPDPLGEDFCGIGNNFTCLPFMWRKGALTALPTLGGNNGEATALNSRGQVVGLAENDKPDQTCPPPGPPFFAVLQFKPVVWTKGEVHKLPTTHGDPDGAALFINDNEQVVGNTSDCTFSTFHGVMWDHGRAIGLGKFHGLLLGPVAINNRGQVVGSAFDLSGTTLVAFLWQNGVTTILGTLAHDVFSLGRGINDRGEIVGDSCDEFFDCRAFLWRNGRMTELNDLVSTPNAPFLENAFAINSRGQIAGKTTVQGTPLADAYLATPSPGQSVTRPAKTTSHSSIRRASTPEDIRNVIRQRLVRGYHSMLTAPQN